MQYKPESCTRKAKSGDEVKVHYKGTLTDGTVFDDSTVRGSPIKFILGQKNVIDGKFAGVRDSTLAAGFTCMLIILTL